MIEHIKGLGFWVSILAETLWVWLTTTEPDYTTVTTGSRDRSLRGKARRRARRQA